MRSSSGAEESAAEPLVDEMRAAGVFEVVEATTKSQKPYKALIAEDLDPFRCSQSSGSDREGQKSSQSSQERSKLDALRNLRAKLQEWSQKMDRDTPPGEDTSSISQQSVASGSDSQRGSQHSARQSQLGTDHFGAQPTSQPALAATADAPSSSSPSSCHTPASPASSNNPFIALLASYSQQQQQSSQQRAQQLLVAQQQQSSQQHSQTSQHSYSHEQQHTQEKQRAIVEEQPPAQPEAALRASAPEPGPAAELRAQREESSASQNSQNSNSSQKEFILPRIDRSALTRSRSPQLRPPEPAQQPQAQRILAESTEQQSPSQEISQIMDQHVQKEQESVIAVVSTTPEPSISVVQPQPQISMSIKRSTEGEEAFTTRFSDTLFIYPYVSYDIRVSLPEVIPVEDLAQNWGVSFVLYDLAARRPLLLNNDGSQVVSIESAWNVAPRISTFRLSFKIFEGSSMLPGLFVLAVELFRRSSVAMVSSLPSSQDRITSFSSIFRLDVSKEPIQLEQPQQPSQQTQQPVQEQEQPPAQQQQLPKAAPVLRMQIKKTNDDAAAAVFESQQFPEVIMASSQGEGEATVQLYDVMVHLPRELSLDELSKDYGVIFQIVDAPVQDPSIRRKRKAVQASQPEKKPAMSIVKCWSEAPYLSVYRVQFNLEAFQQHIEAQKQELGESTHQHKFSLLLHLANNKDRKNSLRLESSPFAIPLPAPPFVPAPEPAPQQQEEEKEQIVPVFAGLKITLVGRDLSKTQKVWTRLIEERGGKVAMNANKQVSFIVMTQETLNAGEHTIIEHARSTKRSMVKEQILLDAMRMGRMPPIDDYLLDVPAAPPQPRIQASSSASFTPSTPTEEPRSILQTLKSTDEDAAQCVKPEDNIIACPCEDDDQEGLMICCDHCNRWGHARCYGITSQKDIPEFFLCNRCKILEQQLEEKKLRSFFNKDDGNEEVQKSPASQDMTDTQALAAINSDSAIGTGSVFNESDCGICLLDLCDGQELYSLELCSHTFHLECIAKCLQSRYIRKRCTRCCVDVPMFEQKKINQLCIGMKRDKRVEKRTGPWSSSATGSAATAASSQASTDSNQSDEDYGQQPRSSRGRGRARGSGRGNTARGGRSKPLQQQRNSVSRTSQEEDREDEAMEEASSVIASQEHQHPSGCACASHHSQRSQGSSSSQQQQAIQTVPSSSRSQAVIANDDDIVELTQQEFLATSQESRQSQAGASSQPSRHVSSQQESASQKVSSAPGAPVSIREQEADVVQAREAFEIVSEERSSLVASKARDEVRSQEPLSQQSRHSQEQSTSQQKISSIEEPGTCDFSAAEAPGAPLIGNKEKEEPAQADDSQTTQVLGATASQNSQMSLGSMSQKSFDGQASQGSQQVSQKQVDETTTVFLASQGQQKLAPSSASQRIEAVALSSSQQHKSQREQSIESLPASQPIVSAVRAVVASSQICASQHLHSEQSQKHLSQKSIESARVGSQSAQQVSQRSSQLQAFDSESQEAQHARQESSQIDVRAHDSQRTVLGVSSSQKLGPLLLATVIQSRSQGEEHIGAHASQGSAVGASASQGPAAEQQRQDQDERFFLSLCAQSQKQSQQRQEKSQQQPLLVWSQEKAAEAKKDDRAGSWSQLSLTQSQVASQSSQSFQNLNSQLAQYRSRRVASSQGSQSKIEDLFASQKNKQESQHSQKARSPLLWSQKSFSQVKPTIAQKDLNLYEDDLVRSSVEEHQQKAQQPRSQRIERFYKDVLSLSQTSSSSSHRSSSQEKELDLESQEAAAQVPTSQRSQDDDALLLEQEVLTENKKEQAEAEATEETFSLASSQATQISLSKKRTFSQLSEEEPVLSQQSALSLPALPSKRRKIEAPTSQDSILGNLSGLEDSQKSSSRSAEGKKSKKRSREEAAAEAAPTSQLSVEEETLASQQTSAKRPRLPSSQSSDLSIAQFDSQQNKAATGVRATTTSQEDEQLLARVEQVLKPAAASRPSSLSQDQNQQSRQVIESFRKKSLKEQLAELDDSPPLMFDSQPAVAAQQCSSSNVRLVGSGIKRIELLLSRNSQDSQDDGVMSPFSASQL